MTLSVSYDGRVAYLADDDPAMVVLRLSRQDPSTLTRLGRAIHRAIPLQSERVVTKLASLINISRGSAVARMTGMPLLELNFSRRDPQGCVRSVCGWDLTGSCEVRVGLQSDARGGLTAAVEINNETNTREAEDMAMELVVAGEPGVRLAARSGSLLVALTTRTNVHNSNAGAIVEALEFDGRRRSWRLGPLWKIDFSFVMNGDRKPFDVS